MKSTTYARFTLLLPYLTLIESIGYFKIHEYKYENAPALQVLNEFWNFFAFFWVVPYTILVIYLIIWSLNKTKEQVQTFYTDAPIKMMFITPLTYIVILTISSLVDKTFFRGLGSVLIVAACVSIPASLALGFAFVQISLLFYEFLRKVKFIQD